MIKKIIDAKGLQKPRRAFPRDYGMLPHIRASPAYKEFVADAKNRMKSSNIISCEGEFNYEEKYY